MKGIKTMIVSALAAVVLGLSFSPITASADESVPGESVSVEIVDKLPEEQPKEETNKITEEKVYSTFEEFLAWMEMEAEVYGHEGNFKNALKAIKTAATTKQVTISTLCSIGVVVMVIAFSIRAKIKDKALKQGIADCANQLNSLINGANSLVDETNAQIKVEKATQQEVQKLETQVQALQKGLQSFTTAFLRFSDGVKLGDNKKNEVQTNCIAAITAFDEVKQNDVKQK